MGREKANQIVRNMIKVSTEVREIAEITILEIDTAYRRTITQAQIDRQHDMQSDKVKPW